MLWCLCLDHNGKKWCEEWGFVYPKERTMDMNYPTNKQEEDKMNPLVSLFGIVILPSNLQEMDQPMSKHSNKIPLVWTDFWEFYCHHSQLKHLDYFLIFKLLLCKEIWCQVGFRGELKLRASEINKKISDYSKKVVESIRVGKCEMVEEWKLMLAF